MSGQVLVGVSSVVLRGLQLEYSTGTGLLLSNVRNRVWFPLLPFPPLLPRVHKEAVHPGEESDWTRLACVTGEQCCGRELQHRQHRGGRSQHDRGRQPGGWLRDPLDRVWWAALGRWRSGHAATGQPAGGECTGPRPLVVVSSRHFVRLICRAGQQHNPRVRAGQPNAACWDQLVRLRQP